MSTDRPSSPSSRESGPGSAQRLRSAVAGYAGLLAVLAVMIAFFSWRSTNFLTTGTLATIANQNADLIVVSVGMTFVLMIGGIDLSVGSVMALCSSVVGVAMVRWQLPLWPAMGLALAVGIVCGLFNGAITVTWSIPSFIVTLGMLEIARGTAFHVTGSETMYIGRPIAGIAKPLGFLQLSPAFWAALAIVVVGQFVLTRTVFGRYMTAIGHNEQVVRYSGVTPWPTKLAVFAIVGALCGLAGVFQASRLASADPNAGVGFELSAIAAAVIGGTSLMGGRGSVVNTFLGVLVIAVLQTGLASVGATEPTKRIITGAVIILAVIADVYRRRLTGAGRSRKKEAEKT